MSQAQEKAANSAHEGHWQQVPRCWGAETRGGGVPAEQRNGPSQKSILTPIERWLNEGRKEGPWDNVNAVKMAAGAVHNNDTRPIGSTGNLATVATSDQS